MKKNEITMRELEVLLNREFLGHSNNDALYAEQHEIIAKQTFSKDTVINSWGLRLMVVMTVVVSLLGYLVWSHQRPMFEVIPVNVTSNEAQINNLKSVEEKLIEQTRILPDNEMINGLKGQDAQPNRKYEALIISKDTFLVNENGLDKRDSIQQNEPTKNHLIISDELLPSLTEKEIKKNEREKKNIIKIAAHVAKDRTGSVVKVPDSPDGKIKNFYLEGGEVTNREYRVFLFDLLIHGRKEEFLKAKPYQDHWLNTEEQTTFNYLAKEYFSNRKYDYYPVVNISLEGAEMYCRWIQSEVDKLRLEDNNVNSIEVRLPYEFEWLHAAKGGRTNAVYPWPIDSVQNRSNCFMANFCAQKLKNEFNYPINYGKHQIDLTCYTTVGVFMRKHEIATIEVWSYNPNAFGLFCMSGNVSELVYKNDRSGIKTMGGNWASDYKHLRLDSEDEFENKIEPSPKIGFRVCVILK